MPGLDPNLISLGDLVIIEDQRKNVLSGPAIIQEGGGHMALKAFGFEIPFAVWSGGAVTGSYAMKPGIKLIEHQPSSLLGSEPYIDGKTALQRNPRFKTNPT